MENNSKETIQNFGDMVNATEQLSKPWQEASKRSFIALLVTNAFWALIVAMLIWFAYMTPIDAQQEQDFAGQTQNQHYSEGVTNGD